MDARLLDHMFAQVVDPNIHELRAIERAAPQVWGRRRMRGHAMKVDLEGVHRQRCAIPDQIGIARMPGQGRIQVVKDAILGHKGLANQGLFGRAAIKANRACEVLLFHGRLHGQSRPQARGAKEIMPTAMTRSPFGNRIERWGHFLGKARQGIVLTQDADDRFA